ncbi:enoyl-CoA hydratase [Microbacterium sp. MPKO10]|uniref:enoyl-CoA hydratase n=1 Tax=Microbacterium sp. MPKO10 TaxID=2989818 RepID=UPI002235BC4C|nr:enoyl-CoA hydratase [Microbacterium sp. MPKO10]MCW4458660.1 enoyl-CoA hydratase [Microbacterium sp. MPKO10]
MTARAEVTLSFDKGCARIVLSNPGKRNALTWEMYEQLEAHLDELSRHENLRALVITGTAADGFAAGTDISQFAEFASADDGIEYERRVGRILGKLDGLAVPTIAEVHGTAVGAGLAIAVMCDIIVADRSARFGAPIVRTLGNCLPGAVFARLRDRLGSARTLSMLLTAALVSADDLLASGFVLDSVEEDQLHDRVETVIRGIRRSAPRSLAALKALDRRLSSGDVDDEDLLRSCYGSDDFMEGVSAFLEHRHPHWKGY